MILKPDKVWRTLNHRDALPVRLGDAFRVEAGLSRPAYLYVIWVTADGEAFPIYPWEPGKWRTRPAVERPTATVGVPPADSKNPAYELLPGSAGVETLLMFARDTPLAVSDAEIEGWLKADPPAAGAGLPAEAVWLVNGETGRGTRGNPFEKRVAVDSPVLRVQAVVRRHLQPHAVFTAGVCFPRRAD